MGLIYGEYNVPFNGSGEFSPDAKMVYNESIWWIPQFDIPFLLLVIIIGLIGNIAIIGAIIWEKKLKFAGNAFIVNLAVADLIITTYILPGVLANVIMNRNMFPRFLCRFTAVILSMSSIASMYSLMLVAINRYVAIAHNAKYMSIFTNGKIAAMITGVWIWSLIVTIPPAFGWGDYRYHKKIHVCMYDCNAEEYLTFTVSYVCITIILPFLVTCCCYYGIFRAFDCNRQKVRSMTTASTVSIASTTEKHKICKSGSTLREDRERRLVITLLASVTLFTVCWLPYALIILINHHAPAFYKRSAAWLAFTNSSMNSILYGVLNRNFRSGYKKMWVKISSLCAGFKTVDYHDPDTSPIATKEMSVTHDLDGRKLESEPLDVTRLASSQNISFSRNSR